MNKEECLERYSRSLGSEGKTRGLYIRYATDFLEYSNGNFDREVIMKYLERIRRKSKYSDGSVNFIFRVIRTLFNRNAALLATEGIEWPFRRGETPQIREKNVQAPALNPITIGRMIKASREKGNIAEQTFLALSSTYGLRRIEMINLNPKDVNLKDKVIHIATVKHGRERSHIIPEEIIPILKTYDFERVMSEFTLLGIWYLIEYRIGLKHISRVGFHSIRRTLNTLLARQLSDITVKSFLRHKQRTSSDMTYRYSAITFVGEAEDVTELSSDSYTVDQEVFSVHPFLEHWR